MAARRRVAQPPNRRLKLPALVDSGNDSLFSAPRLQCIPSAARLVSEADVNATQRATARLQSATPCFAVPDVVRTAEYYRDTLGFEILGYWNGAQVSLEAQPVPVFGIVRRDAVQVFFSRAQSGEARPVRPEGGCDAYIQVTAVDALAQELRRRGAGLLDGPVDRVYNQREIEVKDCNGLVLVFAEDTSGRGA